MRFQCALPLATTVGCSVAMRNTLRPSEGISLKSLVSSVPPCDALLVSMSGAEPLTAMFSSRPPTSSTMSRLRNCCVPMRTFGFTYGPEARHVDLQRVARRIDGWKRVLPHFVRDCFARGAGRGILQRDGCARDDALRVFQRAAHATLERLRVDDSRQHERREEDAGQCPPGRSPHETSWKRVELKKTARAGSNRCSAVRVRADDARSASISEENDDFTAVS